MRTSIRMILCGAVMSGLACSSAAVPAQPSTGASNAEPKSGGVVRFPIPNDFYDFDPSYAGSGTPNYSATMLANETLLGFKTGPDVANSDLVLTPRVAERWEVSPDAKAFTFHIRSGVKYANLAPVNGRA